jgi:hypothetical protein
MIHFFLFLLKSFTTHIDNVPPLGFTSKIAFSVKETILDILLLTIMLPLLWNLITAIYLTIQARQGRLSPFKLALTFSLGFSFMVSATIFLLISTTEGITSRGIGFLVIVFFFLFLIGFPTTYFSSRILLRKIFPRWSSLTSQIQNPKEDKAR